jgi:hypothetical protein
MGKRLVSICLFLLFCIVIAFPGYGISKSASKKEKSICAQIKNTESDIITFEALLKNCLANGISIAEEERPADENETEDEANSGIDEDTLSLAFATSLQHPIVCNEKFNSKDNNYQIVTLRGVPNPPPECVLI